jgi:thiamine pyrophosphate-dependent acetolactate synthase large subunit-like protein
MTGMLVYEAVGETLRRLGVDTAFGLVGSGNMRFVTHMTHGCGMSYYAARHESPAVSMADGYTRVSGKLAVATVTEGPGITNALTGLTEAVKGSTPVLFLTGDTPPGVLGMNQDIDQAAAVSALGIGVQRLRSHETIVEDLARAANRAVAEQRPIMFSIPNDIQDRQCEADALDTVRPAVRARPVPPDAAAVSELSDLIQASKRPLLIAGRGAVRSRARDALSALGDRIGALMSNSGQAKAIFAGHPFNIGVTGRLGSPLAGRLVGEADLVLAFGARLTYWGSRSPIAGRTGERIFSPEAQIVQIDSNPSALGSLTSIRLGVLGDAAATAAALLEELTRRSFSSGGARSPELQDEIAAFSFPQKFDSTMAEGCADPAAVFSQLDAMLPRDRNVVVDSGRFLELPARYLNVPEPQAWVFTQDFMSLGLGLGSAVGAAVARPDRFTVCVAGDGGLMMSLGELDTLVRYKLPILVLVVNDHAYGPEVEMLRLHDMPIDHALFDDVDFAAIARDVGARGLTIRDEGGVQQLRPWLQAPDGPLVVDCKIDPLFRAEGRLGA